jgi:hypothetical protein
MFCKETRFGTNAYRVQHPVIETECCVQHSDTSDRFKWIHLNDLPEEVVHQIVSLETKVCQDLFPEKTLSWPWTPENGIRAKIPTRYSHIIIPMTDSEARRIVSAQLRPGARLRVRLQPSTAWAQDTSCGIAWTIQQIVLLF